MAKIIKFPRKGEEPEENQQQQVSKEEEKTREVKPSIISSKREKAQYLTEEDIKKLFEPFREGLKKLYPSQVEDVLGFYGLGEKNEDKVFLVGAVIWKRYGVEHPYTSTFVAIFEKGELTKISFLEAKRNYWDWKTLLKTYKSYFHTEEIFNRFQEILRGQFLT